MAEGFMSLREAREYLGVSKMKMWRLVKEGAIETYENALDKRTRLVKFDDIDKLKQPRLRVS